MNPTPPAREASLAQTLAERREALVALGAIQRASLGLRWQAAVRPPAWTEPGRIAWGYARERPWLLVLPLAAIAAARPRWIWSLGSVAIAIWRARRLIRRWI